MTLRTLRLQTDISLPRLTHAPARDLLAINRQLDHPVVARNPIVIPLRRRLTPPFARQAPLRILRRMRPIRHHRRPPNRKNIAVAGVGIGIAAIEDLNFDAAAERLTGERDWIAPDEDAGVAGRMHV